MNGLEKRGDDGLFDMNETFVKTVRQREVFELGSAHAKAFAPKAAHYDQTGDFPFDNFEALKASGYTALTLPAEKGGKDISLYEFALVQETLAQGDGATTLGIGWHLGIMMDLAARREWKEATFAKLCDQVAKDKALINRAATEPQTGSPIRGGKPQTEAVRTDSGWLLNGRKTFTSLAPIADYFIVSASIKGSEDSGGFLVHRKTPGVRFKKTWDTLGMRATRSDDLILDNVELPEEAYVERIGWQDKDHTPPGWLIHIPACYLGIALACRRDVIDFAEKYMPNSLERPIAELPHVQQKMGKIDFELMKARYLMYGVAEQWDENADRRKDMGADLQAVKYAATHAAMKVVDIAMRIVGGTSILRSNPFERYYRDVRAGIHNPPSDDAVLGTLGKRVFSKE